MFLDLHVILISSHTLKTLPRKKDHGVSPRWVWKNNQNVKVLFPI